MPLARLKSSHSTIAARSATASCSITAASAAACFQVCRSPLPGSLADREPRPAEHMSSRTASVPLSSPCVSDFTIVAEIKPFVKPCFNDRARRLQARLVHSQAVLGHGCSVRLRAGVRDSPLLMVSDDWHYSPPLPPLDPPTNVHANFTVKGQQTAAAAAEYQRAGAHAMPGVRSWAATSLLLLLSLSWLAAPVTSAAAKGGGGGGKGGPRNDWTANVIASTQPAYKKSPKECYTLQYGRNSTVVLTALLDDYDAAYFDANWIRRLTSSLANFSANNEADFIFFHTGWSEAQVHQFQDTFPTITMLCIATSHWAAERNFTDWENVMNDGPANSGYPGYRSMCKWYSTHSFSVLLGMGYKWMIRMDTDSEFLKPIPYNLVEVMKEAGAEYGFRAWWVDFPRFVRGLPEAAHYWLVAEDIKPSWIRRDCRPPAMSGITTRGWSRHIFYNNFFITNLRWWAQPHIQGWLQHLMHSNGFYKFRWGDAPVQTMTLGMFMPRDKILELGFAYLHKHEYTENGFTQKFFPRYHCNQSGSIGCEVITEESERPVEVTGPHKKSKIQRPARKRRTEPEAA